MLIKLPDIKNASFSEVHVGSRKRLATASGCTFLSKNTLAILNLVSQRIYIIKADIENRHIEYIDSIETTFDGKLCASDLLSSSNDIIAVTNFDRSISLYKYSNNKLSRYREFAFPDLGYCHGIKFYTDNIICFTTMQLVDVICFFDIHAKSMLYTMDFHVPGPKDICFLSKSRLVAIYTTKPPSPHKPYELSDSKVLLIEFDLERKSSSVLSEFTIPQSQVDGCDKIGNLVYITVSQENMDSLYVLDTSNDRLRFHDLIEGFRIPHGISTFGHLLAVTNYIDNTVRIIDTRDNTFRNRVLSDEPAYTFKMPD